MEHGHGRAESGPAMRPGTQHVRARERPEVTKRWSDLGDIRSYMLLAGTDELSEEMYIHLNNKKCNSRGRETGLPKATRFHEAGRWNEAGVGDGSNRLSGPGYPVGKGPFRSFPLT